MTDRAAEIAREIGAHTTEGFPLMDGEYTAEELVQVIAAALRSYGNEMLEEWRRTTAENNVPDGV